MHIAMIGGAGRVGTEALTHFYTCYANAVEKKRIPLKITLVTRIGRVEPAAVLTEELPQVRSGDGMRPFQYIQLGATSKYSDLKDADLVVVLASAPPLSNQKKKDLLAEGMDYRVMLSYGNLPLMRDVSNQIQIHCPKADVLVVTNQSDLLSMVVQQYLPNQNVAGFGGMLDSVRYRHYVSSHLGNLGSNRSKISDRVRNCMIVGHHTDGMVLLESSAADLSVDKSVLKTALEVTRKEPYDLTIRAGGGNGALKSNNTPAKLPGCLLAKFFAARIGAIEPIKAPFNVPLANGSSKLYGVPKGGRLSVPVVVSTSGLEVDRSYTVTSDEQARFAGMEESMRGNLDSLIKSDSAHNLRAEPAPPSSKKKTQPLQTHPQEV